MRSIPNLKHLLPGLTLVVLANFLLLAAAGYTPVARADNMTPDEIDQYNLHDVDKWNRVATLYSRVRVGSDSMSRGQEIYYMRCWMCHSELVTVGDHFPAPSLRDLFDRVDEAYVKARLRSGSAGMPTYAPVNLTDQDIDDLVTYMKANCGKLKTGSGCFDEHNPPPNPLYKY